MMKPQVATIRFTRSGDILSIRKVFWIDLGRSWFGLHRMVIVACAYCGLSGGSDFPYWAQRP
jgi:hypothetical protein